MPASFLSSSQRLAYGRFAGPPTAEELSRHFHLSDSDLALLAGRRGEHNRLGFALQLTTVRYLGTFLTDPAEVPEVVLQTLGRQLAVGALDCIREYSSSERRWDHAAEIRAHGGYRDFTERSVSIRLARWLYAVCWTGTDRPSVLFDRATDWLLTHKVLLPGVSVLERFVIRLRDRVDKRIWRVVGRAVEPEQRGQLDELLVVLPGRRGSLLDALRSGPFTVSAPALVRALDRLQEVRDLRICIPKATAVPLSRLDQLARLAHTAKLTAIARLTPERRLATLAAFVHSLQATAQDDALEVLEMLLAGLFGSAEKADRRARLRTLKDIDHAAATLAEACEVVFDSAVSDEGVRAAILSRIPRGTLQKAVKDVRSLVRPPDDVFYCELARRYLRVRRFLPALARRIHFEGTPAGQPVVAAMEWFRAQPKHVASAADAPREVISKAWMREVMRGGHPDLRAYTFCVLDRLREALKRRDVFVTPSWRYSDPRAGLLAGAEWEATRPVICRTLGLSVRPEPVMEALAEELDRTYRSVASRLPDNPAVRFESVAGRQELVLTPFDRLDEPSSLVALREAVVSRMPQVEIPEVLVEIAARTGFTEAFTHVSEAKARAEDLNLSLCAVLLAEACNTGPDPLIRPDHPAFRRDRLSWVGQNYLRQETLAAANARLVAAQNSIGLAHAWGGGEVASADGMRFVVPVRTVHAGPNPKYYGMGRGVTWYNLVSNQFTGLNGIPVPGTLRDSLILLAVVLEQQTELQPAQIMTDTGAYSDVVFGLFRLLGFRFCPRLADIGGARFWRIEPLADYGALNAIARHHINPGLVYENWDDMLRLAGSLKMGRVPAAGIMRTLQVGDRPTRLAQAIAEFGRIDKTIHALTTIDDENKRRGTLLQLNRGEGRHSLARMVFHGKRGELRQRYREGQEDQLGALGLVVNIIVLWNTLYMDAALAQFRGDGFPVQDEDVARLSPLIHDHINMLGRYSFAVPDAVARGELRPLRDPQAVR